MLKYKTTMDFTYESQARKVSLLIPAGTEVQFIGTNAGVKTTHPWAVSNPKALPGCDHFDATHYWYWIPDAIVAVA